MGDTLADWSVADGGCCRADRDEMGGAEGSSTRRFFPLPTTSLTTSVFCRFASWDNLNKKKRKEKIYNPAGKAIRNAYQFLTL